MDEVDAEDRTERAGTGGLETIRREGTPQGGPLSPLLSNIMLDDLDKELERRGHSFCRYADDCNVYVQSQKAGERVMRSIKEFLSNKLKLKVNEEKSAVAPVWERKFLGYSVTKEGKPRLRIAEEALKRFKDKLKKKFREGLGRNIKQLVKDLTPTITGWGYYFYRTKISGQVAKLDKWIRHKLRDIIWRQMKTSETRRRTLIQRGIEAERARELAGSNKGPWRCSKNPTIHMAFPNKYFGMMGLISLAQIRAGALKAL